MHFNLSWGKKMKILIHLSEGPGVVLASRIAQFSDSENIIYILSSYFSVELFPPVRHNIPFLNKLS